MSKTVVRFHLRLRGVKNKILNRTVKQALSWVLFSSGDSFCCCLVPPISSFSFVHVSSGGSIILSSAAVLECPKLSSIPHSYIHGMQINLCVRCFTSYAASKWSIQAAFFVGQKEDRESRSGTLIPCMHQSHKSVVD